jgi:ribA/ribD-fused uncharacterized protein
MTEKFTFFLKGPLSQWHGPLRSKDGKVRNDSRFEIDCVVYNCAEQYMMAEKSRIFCDGDTLDLIMDAKHPRDQQALGRTVAKFDKDVWEAKARDVVYKGNFAKFSQNPHLAEALFATAGTTLVECNPEDAVWGIALSIDDPRRLDRKTWRGTNWLGEVLTKVRDDLMEISLKDAVGDHHPDE